MGASPIFRNLFFFIMFIKNWFFHEKIPNVHKMARKVFFCDLCDLLRLNSLLPRLHDLADGDEDAGAEPQGPQAGIVSSASLPPITASPGMDRSKVASRERWLTASPSR